MQHGPHPRRRCPPQTPHHASPSRPQAAAAAVPSAAAAPHRVSPGRAALVGCGRLCRCSSGRTHDGHPPARCLARRHRRPGRRVRPRVGGRRGGAQRAHHGAHLQVRQPLLRPRGCCSSMLGGPWAEHAASPTKDTPGCACLQGFWGQPEVQRPGGDGQVLREQPPGQEGAGGEGEWQVRGRSRAFAYLPAAMVGSDIAAEHPPTQYRPPGRPCLWRPLDDSTASP